MESVNIKELNDRIQQESGFVDILSLEMGKVIVGQKHLVENLLIALLADGHILLEGMPGLAKTLAISTLSKAVNAKFSRIQFTPDLLPADVTGTLIYSQKKEEFEVHKGPIFANFVLADEINRAPAKVQSALLEAMQERQVTLSHEIRPYALLKHGLHLKRRSRKKYGCFAILFKCQPRCCSRIILKYHCMLRYQCLLEIVRCRLASP